MRRTELLKFIRDYKRPYYCLIENERFDKVSRSYVYHLTFEVTKDGVRCFDWGDGHKVIAYVQDDSDLDVFLMQIKTHEETVDKNCFYEFYKTKKDALKYLKDGFDKEQIRKLKSDLRKL